MWSTHMWIISLCICIHIYIYTDLYIYVYIFMCIFMNIQIYTYIYIYTYINIFIYIHDMYWYIDMYVYMNICINIHRHTYIHAHTPSKVIHVGANSEFRDSSIFTNHEGWAPLVEILKSQLNRRLYSKLNSRADFPEFIFYLCEATSGVIVWFRAYI